MDDPSASNNELRQPSSLVTEELIAWLEAASRGSRELDLEIEKGLRRCPQDSWLEANDEVHWNEVHPFGSTVAYEPLSQPLPRYTTLLDDAMSLKPENFVLYLTIWPGDPDGFDARVEVLGTHKEYGRGSNPSWNYYRRKTDPRAEGKAKTAPLAVCIAVLKVLQACQNKAAREPNV